MPILGIIKKDLSGRNIKFIAVCLSENISWKKMLNLKGLVKNQFTVDKAWDSQFRKDYLKSSGVPVYILINPRGIIVNARAPFPLENLKGILEKLDI